LSQDVTPYNDLDSLISDFKPFYELTQMAFDIKTSFLEWRTGQLMKQDTGLIRNSVSQWQANCNSLRKTLDNEEYHEASDVTMALRSNVDEFSKFLPMVMCITSSAVTDEDWEEITQVLLQDEKIQREKGEGGKVDRNEIKIDDIEKFNLFQFMEEIDDITNKAIKKDSLAQKLKAMKDEMKNFQMSQKEYKSTFLVQEWDEINIKLDDQIVNVQAMNGSSFMKGSLKREAKNWEKKLIDMSELMDKMLKTQRNWMYLEPIFSSGDIANTMPLEYKMFVDVDTHWKSTMNIIAEDPGIIDLVEKENIAKQFDDNNKNLDLIQKKLNDFLEQKRLIFARFFFLANDDLL
jgi:dynein heavy chain